MPRPSKLEVSAINLRIPVDRTRDYTTLIRDLSELRVGIRVYGDSYIAISHFDPSSNLGVISKYTEIDIDSDWFDLEDFDTATPEKIDEISIPENLRPNHSAFYFELNADLHILTFESYSASKALSSRSVEKYFKDALRNPKILEKFGHVESDIIKSYDEVERILSLPNMKELRLIIRRPNPDDISGDLAGEIEERLREQNGEEYEEITRSKDDDGIIPNKRTKKLASVAAENGNVVAKSIAKGILTTHETSEKPQKEVTTYISEQESPMSVFRKLSRLFFQSVYSSRERLAE